MDTEKTLTLEEAIEAFDKISKPWAGIEESFEIDRETLGKQEAEISLVEKVVISENVFSENEEFDEVHEEYARLVVLTKIDHAPIHQGEGLFQLEYGQNEEN